MPARMKDRHKTSFIRRRRGTTGRYRTLHAASLCIHACIARSGAEAPTGAPGLRLLGTVSFFQHHTRAPREPTPSSPELPDWNRVVHISHTAEAERTTSSTTVLAFNLSLETQSFADAPAVSGPHTWIGRLRRRAQAGDKRGAHFFTPNCSGLPLY